MGESATIRSRVYSAMNQVCCVSGTGAYELADPVHFYLFPGRSLCGEAETVARVSVVKFVPR